MFVIGKVALIAHLALLRLVLGAFPKGFSEVQVEGVGVGSWSLERDLSNWCKVSVILLSLCLL